MTRRNTLLGCAVLLFAPLLLAQCEPATSEPTLSDRDVGLAKGSIFDVLVPAAVAENQTDPGDSLVLPRAFEGAPPRVSHAIADLLPITRDENLCVDCHHLEDAEEGDPTTPIPESHFVDMRNRPTEVGDEVAGARYYCVTCHVVGSDAALLVANPASLP